MECENACFPIVQRVAQETLHPSIVVSGHQTGVIVIPGVRQTSYERRSARGAMIYGKDE